MKFADFDPTVWTNKDLDNLSNLWIEYETVIKNLKEVNFKIKDQIMTNEALKNEIESSTKRCNEITKNESHVSIESAKEIVELSKNIKNIRKQEDEVEKQIVSYKKEMEKLREKRNQLEENINLLNEEVNQRKIVNSPINGKVEILPFKKIDNKINNNSTSIIITTEKYAVLPLKNTYKRSINNKEELNEELKDKINKSDLINNIDKLNEKELIINEIKNRKNNYQEAIDAIELSDITTKELESKQQFDIKLMDVKEEGNKIEITTDQTEKEKNPENNISLFENNNEEKNIEEKEILKEENEIDKEEVKENESDAVIPLNIEEKKEEVIPINIEDKKEDDKIIPIKEEIIDKINVKSNLTANAKLERLSVINSIYSKDEELNGIKPRKVNNEVIGFTVDSSLDSVKKYNEINSKIIKIDTTKDNVGNIFSSNKEEIKEDENIKIIKAA